MSKRRVCLIGIFPPPLHGMSLINDYVNRYLSKKTSTLVINYSPDKLGGKFITKLYKFICASKCIVQFFLALVCGQIGVVYIGLSGGKGQFYDLLFLLLGRLFLKPLYLHHHSYQYIESRSALTSILIRIAGKSATHIVACNLMAADLRVTYDGINNLRVISGISALTLLSTDYTSRSKIHTIGFISNISLEKGILDFLEIAKWAQRHNLDVGFNIAGPFESEYIKSVIQEQMEGLVNTVYLGPLYDAEKIKFFDSIDVLLFPTKNESEGLVIHEAMSRGVPVITRAKGCISEIISSSSGIVIPPNFNYVSCAITSLQDWLDNPKNYQLASLRAYDQFLQARKINVDRMNKLCGELLEGHK